MNKLAAAVQELKLQDGTYGAETLTIYKKASASMCLGEEYPRIAGDVVHGFYKQACEGSDEETVLRTSLFVKGLNKIAGEGEISRELLEKLAVTAINNKTASSHENDVECYEVICGMIKGTK